MKDSKLWNIPFWSICISIILGIVLSSFISIRIYWFLGTTILFLLFLYLIKTKSSIVFISTSCIAFFTVGAYRYQLILPQNTPHHITHRQSLSKPRKLVFYITKKFKDSKKYRNYNASLKYVDGATVTGKFLLKVKKQPKVTLSVGEAYAGHIALKQLQTSNFLYGFNYNTYLKSQGISHYANVNFSQLIPILSQRNKLIYMLEELRLQITSSLNQLGLDTKVLQFTKALVLGDKTELDSKIKDAFSKAGVIHILAISGLHVGIVYLIFGGILGIVFFNYKFRIIKSILVLLLLWLFVGFTGASDSALRAATMFSCYEFSRLLLRHQHPLNVLFLSIFILVFINPLIIFSIGFQLSIIAVGSIIIGLPAWYNLWKPKNRISLLLWSVMGVSLCAQIGLLPLSIYYFHQIPGLFLLANIPVMCLIPIVMIFAVGIVLGSYFHFLPKVIVVCYNYVILKLIYFINWVASQEIFIFNNLYISLFTVLILYLFFGYLLWIAYNRKKAIQHIFIMIFGIMCSGFIEINRSAHKQELWVLNTYNNTIILELSSNSINVHSLKPITDFDKQSTIKPLQKELHYQNVTYHTLKQVYRYGNKKIQILNQNFIPNIEYKDAILIVSNSPKINAERFLRKNTPKRVLFAGNNFKKLANQWKVTCNKLNIPYNTISKMGNIKIVP